MNKINARSGATHTAALLLAASLAATGAQAASYTFESFQVPGAGATSIRDINNAGVAVGGAFFETADSQFSRGFVVTGGVLTDFAGPPGAVSWDLVAIGDNGVMFGNYSAEFIDDGFGFRNAGPTKLFSYSGGTFHTLSTPADFLAFGMSPNGRWITGTGTDAQGKTGAIVFDTTLGSVTTLDCAATFCVAAGANNAAKVVGYDRTSAPGGGYTGAGWVYDLTTGVRTDYAGVSGVRAAVRDIDATGVLSGYFADVRLRAAHSFVDSSSAVVPVDAPGAAATFIYGANDGGILVGDYQVDSTGPTIGFIAHAVPEPSTLSLLGLGLAGLGGAFRRRRNRG